jgi:hypothetical protein
MVRVILSSVHHKFMTSDNGVLLDRVNSLTLLYVHSLNVVLFDLLLNRHMSGSGPCHQHVQLC